MKHMIHPTRKNKKLWRRLDIPFKDLPQLYRYSKGSFSRRQKRGIWLAGNKCVYGHKLSQPYLASEVFPPTPVGQSGSIWAERKCTRCQRTWKIKDASVVAALITQHQAIFSGNLKE
ncbi:hypothetical protein UFOVP276_199 [uncultured Caudovirales phage]|uniref:Uncharacterized protein n=1 Tax=uncultured Caudovirales phage TaxID=2100421 RepID=A0A6J5LII0_9CAUD|nr:hypothetical protein UFOVP127_93 [uncultured Caudovirales phage]CAB4135243.1 hypothetical protein UFOVP276_199 [uncultured Caudovirales phage]